MRIYPAVVVVTVLAGLVGCASAQADSSAESPTQQLTETPLAASPATVPLATETKAAEEATSEELEIGSVGLDDIYGVTEPGCGIQLIRPGGADGEGFVLYETQEKALMTIDGSLTEFTHEDGSILGESETRTLASAENGYILTLDAPIGADIPGQEAAEIPDATITVRSADGPETTFPASGTLAC